MTDLRIGTGSDVHALAQGRRLVLGGVTIDHARGLAGHSDGDVAVHALIDALLGAAALPDIGQMFPSSDPRYADADSVELLVDVVRKLAHRGWSIVNVDLTILACEPRLAPHTGAMRARLATALGVEADWVGIKATSTDGLGAIGRGEGIAAHAVALIQRVGAPGQ